MYCFHLSTQIASHRILINSAVSSQDGGNRFLWKHWFLSTRLHILIPGSQLSATRRRRCIVLSGVWTEYFLNTAQKHNSINRLNSQAPRNILFLNSHCQLKSQKLSNAGMTDCYNRLWCLWSLSQKMLIAKHRINEYMNLPLSCLT
jgi:nicotinamide riboside transporter PnuC